jgi:hypothetical protein
VGLRVAYTGLWQTLCDATGHDPERPMCREAFDRAMGVLARDESAYERNLAPMTTALLDAADTDGDGVLQHEEAVCLVRAFGIPQGEAAELATALDEDGDGLITREDLVTAYRDYLMSDDIERPGNALFGWIIV